MDFEDCEEHNFDSDFVDEETEHKLYSAIFFGASVNESYSPTIARSTGLPLNYSEPPLDCPFSNTDIQIPLSLGTIQRKSSANVSSFQDDSFSDAGEFSAPVDTERVDISSTSDEDATIDLYVEATSDDPATSPYSLRHFTPGDVILSVAGNSTSASRTNGNTLSTIGHIPTDDRDSNSWRVDLEDISFQRPSHRDSRYFTDVFNAICSTCKKRGHFSSDCRSFGPSCILCGDEGHTKKECKNIYCYICLAPGHSKRSCTLRNRLRHSVCQRCGLQGHQSHLCTELWRQYRHTIEAGRPVRPSWNMFVNSHGCCNCGRQGHTVEDCKRKQFRSSFMGPSPRRCVRVYDRKDIYRKLNSHSMNELQTEKPLLKTKASQSTAQQRSTALQSSVGLQRRSISRDLLGETLTRHVTAEIKSLQSEVAPVGVSSATNAARPRRRPSTDGSVFISLYPKDSAFCSRKKHESKSDTAHRRLPHTLTAKHSPFQWITERVAVRELNANESTPVASKHSSCIKRKHSDSSRVTKKRELPTEYPGAPLSNVRRKKMKQANSSLKKNCENQQLSCTSTNSCRIEMKQDGSYLAKAVNLSSSPVNCTSEPTMSVKKQRKLEKKHKKNHSKLYRVQPNSSTWFYALTKPTAVEPWGFPSTSTSKTKQPQSRAKRKNSLHNNK